MNKALLSHRVLTQCMVCVCVWYRSWILETRSLDLYCRYYAICQPTRYLRTRRTLNPWTEVLVSFLSAFIIVIPSCFAKNVEATSCIIPLGSSFNINNIEYTSFYPLENDTYCYCILPSKSESRNESSLFLTYPSIQCFNVKNNEGVTDSVIFMIYKIFLQVLVTIGPSMFLVIVNIAIIREYNVSTMRKKKLRASKFVQRTASTLFPKKGSKFFESGSNKKSQRSQQDPRMENPSSPM